MDKDQYKIMYELELSHWWYVGMREIALSILPALSEADQGKPFMILDAGCGTGGMMLSLKDYGWVAGIDLSHDAVKLCRTRNISRVCLASVCQLPFEEGVFGLVTSFDVLYHMAVVDDVMALEECRRVLKPGGFLLLRVPAFEFLRSSHDVVVHTRHRYSLGEVRKAVEKAGLRPEKITYANTLLFPFQALVRGWQRATGQAHQARADLRREGPFLNSLLKGVLFLEAKLLKKVDFPVGVSILCLARKI